MLVFHKIHVCGLTSEVVLFQRCSLERGSHCIIMAHIYIFQHTCSYCRHCTAKDITMLLGTKSDSSFFIRISYVNKPFAMMLLQNPLFFKPLYIQHVPRQICEQCKIYMYGTLCPLCNSETYQQPRWLSYCSHSQTSQMPDSEHGMQTTTTLLYLPTSPADGDGCQSVWKLKIR